MTRVSVQGKGTGNRQTQNELAREAWVRFVERNSLPVRELRQQTAAEIIEGQGGVTPTLRALGLRPSADRKSAEGKEYLRVRRNLERYAAGTQAPSKQYLEILRPLANEQERQRITIAEAGTGRRASGVLPDDRSIVMSVAGEVKVSDDERHRDDLWAEFDGPDDLAFLELDPMDAWDELKGFSQGADVTSLDSISFDWA